MAEQEPEQQQSDPYSFMRNRLKDVDITTLQNAIAKAVSDLIGVELRCSIAKIDYTNRHFSHTSADFEVSLSEPYRSLDEILKQVKPT